MAIAGAFATADSLSNEKRDGTLGLLFLTDLKPYDVILGKLTSSSLAIVYRVLGLFPILAMCFLLGGVSKGEVLRTVLVTLNLLMLSLAIGIFASAASRDGRAAIRLAAIILVVLLIAMPALAFFVRLAGRVPFAEALVTCWIAGGGIAAKDSIYQSNQGVFWGNAGFMQVLSWTFLWLACRIVPSCWQDRPMSPESGLWKRISGWFALRPNAQKRAAMLDQNPYFWRARQRQTARLYAWSALVFGALFWVGAVVSGNKSYGIYMEMTFLEATVDLLLITQLAVKLVAASEASRAISEDRHNGAMELLLTTPLSQDQIVRGQGRALFHVLAAPVMILLAIATTSFVIGLQAVQQWHKFSFVVVYILGVGGLAFDLTAARWTGLWLGLSERSAPRAFSGTVFRILLLPALIFALLMTFANTLTLFERIALMWKMWVIVCIICNVFFMKRAKSCLQRRFCSVVTGE